MAKRRSPNYPSMTLEDSIERVRLIYQKEQRHPIPRDSVVEHLGFKAVSGHALAQIGALRAYGLLEGRGDSLRVSSNAAAIIAFTDEPTRPERVNALRECAFAPAVFQDLFEAYGGTPASDSTMRHRLTEQGFLLKAANDVIQTYRDNLAFLDRQGVGYNEGQESETMPASTSPTQQPPTRDPHVNMPPETGRPPQPFDGFFGTERDPSKMYSWQLGKGVKAIVEFKGKTISKEHLSRLQQYLDLFKDAIEDDAEAEDSE